MVGLEELRSVAEDHRVELEIVTHQYQPTVVVSARKGDVTVSSEFGIDLFRERADDGRLWATVLFLKMLERLEEVVRGRTDESGIRSGG